MTVKTIQVEPGEIKAKSTGKAQVGGTGKNFGEFLGAVNAFEPMSTELMYQATGSTNAASILQGAFTGISGASASYGYGAGATPVPTGLGYGTGYGGFGALSEYPGVMGTGKYVAGGTYNQASSTSSSDPSLYTGDLISSMNTNNLKLLELQAVMQSNMQAWNTKSNILSADHRARMAMIEKFTARG